MGYIISERKLKHFYDGIKLKKIAGFASTYPFVLSLVYFSHAGTFDLYHSETLRTYGSSSNCDTFATMFIASNIVQALGQVQTEQGPLLCQLMTHHIISIACYTFSFYFDRLRFWTCFAGLCEVTNLFLIPVFL